MSCPLGGRPSLSGRANAPIPCNDKTSRPETNYRSENKDGDKKNIDSDHQKDKKDGQGENSQQPGPAIDKTKKGNDIVAKVNAPAGAFAKGTTAEISTLSADSKKVAYDITFTDADNKEVQPQAGTPVKVSFAIGNDSDLIDGKEEVELDSLKKYTEHPSGSVF